MKKHSLRKPSGLTIKPGDIAQIPGNTLIQKICNYFQIASIHQLRGHTILIETEESERSYQIGIVSRKEGDANTEGGFILMPEGTLLGLTVQNKSSSLSRFNSSDRTTEVIPFKKVALFFKDKIIMFNDLNQDS
jgi:hypothetical protein